MTTADVRDKGVLSLSNIEEGVTKTDGGLQYMGAKNTENMTQASEEEKKKHKHPNWKCVLLVVWGEISTIKEREGGKKPNNKVNILGSFKDETL